LKIAFVGAGSVVFTKSLLTDTLSFPELHGATVALHDIDPERLQTAGMMARWTSERLGAGATVKEHPDLRGALDEIVAMVDDLIEAHGDAMPEGIRTANVGRRTM
jgi:alpha-galactosidase/6-phospho-beta-glucosidase family protein